MDITRLTPDPKSPAIQETRERAQGDDAVLPERRLHQQRRRLWLGARAALRGRDTLRVRLRQAREARLRVLLLAARPVAAAPHMFAISGLRYDKEAEIVQAFGDEDFYCTNSLLPDEPQLKQLDHIVELQCFAHAFNQACENCQHGGENIKPLVALKGFVREEIVNDNDNLCMTRTTTNQLKGAAVWKFLDDQVTGHRGTACLFSYLAREELDTGKILRRSEMRNICRKMGWALRRCQRNMSQQGQHLSSTAIAEVNHQLDHLYDDMVLG